MFPLRIVAKLLWFKRCCWLAHTNTTPPDFIYICHYSHQSLVSVCLKETHRPLDQTPTTAIIFGKFHLILVGLDWKEPHTFAEEHNKPRSLNQTMTRRLYLLFPTDCSSMLPPKHTIIRHRNHSSVSMFWWSPSPSMFKSEALIWVSFWKAFKFQPFSLRLGSNPRRQSKNIKMKYKTHIELVHESYGTCF